MSQQKCTPGGALIPLHISAEESKMNGWHIGTRTVEPRAFICGERSTKNKVGPACSLSSSCVFLVSSRNKKRSVV